MSSSSTTTNGQNATSPSSSSNGDLASSSSTTSSAVVMAKQKQPRGVSGEDRLNQLESLFCDGGGNNNALLRRTNNDEDDDDIVKALSTETLLDVLVLLYNECCNSSLRKEKTVTDFIELGKEETIRHDFSCRPHTENWSWRFPRV